MFILVWLYLLFTFYVCPFFWEIIDSGVLENTYYFYLSFLFCFFINYFISYWKENFNNNKDILFKFISFLFKPFAYLFTFILCEIKKFYNFLKNFKFKKIINISYLYFKNLLSKLSTIWRPIFKKWSYFGYFRTNKSKWWK